MGFVAPENNFRLKFSGSDYEGLEVVMPELSTGELVELIELSGSMEGMPEDEKAAATVRMFKMIGDNLIEWNLEKPAGTPVPANYEGVKMMPLRFNMAVVTVWISAMAEVDIPLQQGSNGGGTFQEASIPMAPL